MATYRVTAIVTGKGSFPIDMLRYDRCMPDTERDARTVEDTLIPGSVRDPETGKRATWVVNVCKIVNSRQEASRAWTVARWASFGCVCSPGDVFKL
jgi:hypothetical protein